MTALLEKLKTDQDEFFTNPDRRCPCVLLVDTSYSMDGQKMAELNAAMKLLHRELSDDEMTVKRVDMAIISFGPVQVEQDFAAVDKFSMPTVQAGGGTPMGEAIEVALKMAEERRAVINGAGIDLYAPWVFMITDGEATDDLTNAKSAIQTAEEKWKLMFYAIGVDDADMSQLASLSRIPAMKLNGLAFKELALFIKDSLGTVVRTNPGDKITIQNPEVAGFGQIVVE